MADISRPVLGFALVMSLGAGVLVGRWSVGNERIGLERHTRQLETLVAKIDRLSPSRECGSTADLQQSVAFEIRQTIRDELKRCPGSDSRAASTNTPSVAATTPLPEVTEESVAAAHRANGVVDAAISSGHWTNQHATDLGMLVPQLTSEDRDAVLARFAAAVNDGRIRRDSPGPPF